MVYRLGQKNGAAAMQWSPGRLCKALGFASKKNHSGPASGTAKKRGHQRKYEVLREEIRKSEVD